MDNEEVKKSYREELCKVLAIRYGYADRETIDWVWQNIMLPLCQLFEPAQLGLLLTDEELDTKWEGYVNSTSKGWLKVAIKGIAKAQLAKATPPLLAEGARQAKDIINCIKDAQRVHPDWAIADVINLLEFREETKQALKGEKP